jgi:hypothetical protein
MIALGTRDPCPAFTFSAPPANLGWAASNRTEKVLTVSGKELGIIITKMDFGGYFLRKKIRGVRVIDYRASTYS